MNRPPPPRPAAQQMVKPTSQTAAAADSKRVKRWAPRGKTGCVTCRRRKVRCDEAKPICDNCVATRRYCAGPYYQDSAQATADGTKNAAVVIPRLRGTAPPRSVRPTNHRGWEIAPHGWDVVEAFEYLGLYIIPHSVAMDVMATRPATPVALAAYPGSVNSDSFLARVIADRIVWVSCCQRTALSPSTLHGTRDLWCKFHDLIQKHLAQLNYDLTHVQGDFLANSVVGNSVSRIDKQLSSIYEFDDTEIVNLFGETCFTPFPCPKALFAELAAINRLRLTLSTGTTAGLPMPETNAVFKRIQAFHPETWKDTAEFDIPHTPEVVLVARIFQLAVSLYGIQALGLEHVDSSAPDKAAATADLLLLLHKTLKSPKCVSVMTWPCAVAGVAVADGPEANRNLVLDILVRIDSDVLAYGIAAHTIERLQAFWLTKKTGWEECWGDFYLLW
ncbi:Fungal transcriptional regulatory protein [Cordyceps militaris CM01]|uniref:Fungal transcriptional regulatory protein n=1 Tax=Cordyceps militaris (strain CM01) TaxID=983644 RepID=G3JP88_CORMM|nr:Fungal transcriptional regulatory protein [Cordyceps militaris CM01]EGX89698.1 Fungal transcriptional regulatory protein [Cordyceps militaris CM01]